MAQHHQFDILGRLPTTANHDEREDHPQDRIQSGEKHLTIMPNPARTPGPRFLSPTGLRVPLRWVAIAGAVRAGLVHQILLSEPMADAELAEAEPEVNQILVSGTALTRQHVTTQ